MNIYTNVDQAYIDLLKYVSANGVMESNRTGIDTITVFGYSYKLRLEKGKLPLLSTKDMGGKVWSSLIEEIVWYLSGEAHIKEFKKKSGIWSSWADENDNLETAYGRFWRDYPTVSSENRREGEAWAEGSVDQVKNIIDALYAYKEHGDRSRRMVLTAWHPANASVSKLPPCHLLSIFSIVGNKLNVHLTQRSGDIGLGIPFNIACYSFLAEMFAHFVGLELGEFSHSIIDAHIYCGKGEDDPYSHLKGIEEHISREALSYNPHPGIQWLTEGNLKTKEDCLKAINDFKSSDITIQNYSPQPRIKMKVAV